MSQKVTKNASGDGAVTLNLSGGWESIVNNVERHNARVRFEEKLRRQKKAKLTEKILDCALVAGIVIALGVAKLLAPWVATVVALLAVCAGCFLAGVSFRKRW